MVSHSLKSVLSKGVGVRYSVNEQVAGHFEFVSSKLAKHLKISARSRKGCRRAPNPQVVIGTALVVTLKGGKGTAHVILSKKASEHLRHMKKKLALNLRLVVHNGATVATVSTTVVNAFTLGH